MGRRVTVHGLEELERKLKQLPHEVRDGAKEATKESVTAVYKDMRRGVPRASGMLHGAIGRRIKGPLRGEVGVFGKRRAWWGALVEFGTSRTPAQPFAEPAAVREMPRYPERLIRAIRKHLRKLTE